MSRGRLYEKDYRLRLSGHQTFPLRYGWLKKAFDAVAEVEHVDGRRPVFLDDDVIAKFGVGRNMVGSMRHWAAATGIISNDGRATTPLGQYLLGARGLDPFMEDPVTLWLVHWSLCSNPRNTTWFWAFNHFPALTFDRDALVKGIKSLATEHPESRASISTIRNDVACFIRTYVARPPTPAVSREESLDSPMTELGLIQTIGRRDGFRFVRGQKPSLGAGTVAYAVHNFWSGRFSAAETLSFEALAHEPGSPGRVFLLNENALADYLMEIEDVSGGAYRWTETAGLKQLIRTPGIVYEKALKFVRRDIGRVYRRKIAR